MKTRTTPESSNQPVDPDDTGSFTGLPETFDPLLPLLKKSMRHMKEGNEHQRRTNLLLVDLSQSMRRQVVLLWCVTAGLLLSCAGLAFALLALADVGQHLSQAAEGRQQVTGKLEEVTDKLSVIADATKEVRADLDRQPKIRVKAPAEDGSGGGPVLVVEPASALPQVPPSTDAVEIPLDLPSKR